MLHMFMNCDKLTSLDVSKFNTSNVTNMGGMFYNCKKLTSLDVSKFNTINVTEMGSMFYFCNNLTNLDVSKFNTSNVTNMGGMFYYCEKLTSLDVSKFNTSNVTNMGRMFEGCTHLEYLDVSNFSTSNVTNMSQMFHDCQRLKSLDLSNFNTSNVTKMYYMFASSYTLTQLDLSNFNTSNVTNMSGMFSGCSKLQTIYTGDDWSVGSNTTTVNMFYYCLKIEGQQDTKYDVNKQNGEYARVDNAPDTPGYLTYKKNKKVTSISIKKQPTKLTYKNDEDFISDGGEITATYEDNTTKEIPLRLCSVTPIDKNKNGEQTLTVEYFGVTTPITITRTAPMVWATWDNATYTLTVGYDANACGQYEHEINTDKWTPYKVVKCLGDEIVPTNSTQDRRLVKKIIFEESFKNYTPTTTAYWFNQCKDLTTIEGLEYVNTAQVKNMAFMFSSCENLTTIDLKHFNTENVSNMDCMFGDCYKLKTIDLSSLNTEKVTNMSHMFLGCKSLQKLDISNFNTSKVTRMDNMFSYCKKLQTLNISNFNTENVEKIDWMFSSCYNLEILDISSFDMHNVKNIEWMFGQCTNLKTIYVGEKWDLQNLSTDEQNNKYVFYNCTALIGGSGTKYDANHTDYVYAHIDGGESNPGYLSIKTKEVKSIVITTQPTKNTYYIGEDFDPTDGIITITYADNTTTTANLSSAAITAIDQTKPGTQTLTVTYLGKTTEIDITLLEVKAVSIEITSSPITTYYVGDSFNPDGGELTIKYNNGTTQTVALANATITGYNASNTGSQTLTIKYGGVSTTIGVTVLAVDVTSISMSAYPEKTEYTQGESLSLSGGTIYVSYSNGSEEYIALTNAEISGYNPEITGSQTVYVSYGGYETSFTITVSAKTEPEPEPNPNPNPNPEPNPEPEPEPEPQPNPVPVSEITDAPVVKIWSSSNTIYIENAESDITVISTLGSQITKQKPTSTRTEITIPRSGIYIVRTGSTVQKVIIR